MSDTLPKRRRGAQPGNRNRLKHGLYSRRLGLQDRALLETAGSDNPDFELTLARLRLRELVMRQRKSSLRDAISYERAIIHYLNLIAALHRLDFRTRQFRLGVLTRKLVPATQASPQDAAGDLLNLIRTPDGFSDNSRNLPESGVFEPQHSVAAPPPTPDQNQEQR
jgi:hypothetical protein